MSSVMELSVKTVRQLNKFMFSVHFCYSELFYKIIHSGFKKPSFFWVLLGFSRFFLFQCAVPDAINIK